MLILFWAKSRTMCKNLRGGRAEAHKSPISMRLEQLRSRVGYDQESASLLLERALENESPR